ncbi:hypothetical protein [[Phormidium] sp. ETS-05]|uniref:hypothetical protein n=1 Tax=[Phormidium] sp. ETS-05 TaxID=222819 RepID=UPI0018EF0F69|nr:hypothetical protein [[Phormidium] sp. ETS-05]
MTFGLINSGRNRETLDPMAGRRRYAHLGDAEEAMRFGGRPHSVPICPHNERQLIWLGLPLIQPPF